MSSSVLNILNSKPGITSSGIANQVKAMKKGSEALSGGSKYIGRYDLESDGLSRQYDDIRRKQISLDHYDSSSSLVLNKLDMQRRRMNDIQDVMVEFNGKSSNLQSNFKSKQEICDEALDQIASILRTKHNGEYLFGGMTPGDDPLKKNIVKETNYIDGTVTKNYTNTTRNNSSIKLSEQHKVRTDIAYASSDGIAHFIAAIHEFKNNDSIASLARVQELYSKGMSAHGADGIAIGRAIEQANEANVFREKEREWCENVLQDDYSADVVKGAEDIRAGKVSLAIVSSLFKVGNSIMDVLIA